ncbi:MAG: M48 family metalloprotease, partial [Elusimicrobia bacterium]|nr:M48 family metalloprotease [Elusimicrobiota bacterium]
MNGEHSTSKPVLMVKSWQVTTWLMVGFFLLTGGCASVPLGDKLFSAWEVSKALQPTSEAEELAIGREALEENWRGDVDADDPLAHRYLTRVGTALAQRSRRSHLPYQFAMSETLKVNGWSYAGGLIRVTRGMVYFLHDEAELAGLLGHEIAHAAERHVAQRIDRERRTQAVKDIAGAVGALAFERAVQIAKELSLNGFSHREELAADRVGVLLAYEAGYDPWALVDVFDRMTKRVQGKRARRVWRAFQRGHVDSQTRRAQALRQFLRKQGIRPGHGRRGEQPYLPFVKALWERSGRPFTLEDITQAQP